MVGTGWLTRASKLEMSSKASARGRRGMIGLICRLVLQCMVTAPGCCAMGFDTSIVAEITAAVTFMQRPEGQMRASYLLCVQPAALCSGVAER